MKDILTPLAWSEHYSLNTQLRQYNMNNGDLKMIVAL